MKSFKNYLLPLMLIMSSLSNAQNVGIGINTADEKLQVDSTIRIGKNAVIAPGSSRKNMLKFGDVDYVFISEQDQDDRMILRAGSFGFRTGKVGINIDSATAQLDVNGTLRLRNGSGTAGHVLTSDAQGMATWHPPAPATLLNTSFFTASSFVTFANNVATKVPFEDVNVGGNICYDDFGTFNNTTHAFTVPAMGSYHFDVNLRLYPPGATPAVNGSLSIQLYVNGSSVSLSSGSTYRLNNFAAGQPIPLFISTSGLIPLNANDVVEVYFRHNAGFSIDVFNNPSTNFSMFRVK